MATITSMILPLLLLISFFGGIIYAGIKLFKHFRGMTVVEMYRNLDGRYYKVAGARVSNQEDTVKVGDRLYHLDYHYAVMKESLIAGTYAVLQFDIEDAKPMTLKPNTAGEIETYNPKLFHKVMSTKIYSNILSGVTESPVFIILIVLVAVSVLLGGYGAYTGMNTQRQLEAMMLLLNKMRAPA